MWPLFQATCPPSPSAPRAPLQQAGLASRPCAGPFLEALEPHVLCDRLPGLAPEVMQQLVEHFSAGLGRPDRVERCLLHLDVLGMDLDQAGRVGGGGGDSIEDCSTGR